MKSKDQNGKKRKRRAEMATSGDMAPASEQPIDGDLHPDPNYPRYRVEPGHTFKLADIDPNDTEHYRGKDDVKDQLDRQRGRIEELQERLYAERKQSLLVVLQAMDTGGKDGTISHVFEDVNPQGCQVWAFKVPTEEELAHDFLWRVHKVTPRRGMIGVFNRSHYEDVIVVRVHKLVPEKTWKARYDQINGFEQTLALNDTTIIKFFLYISRDEQKRRLESRLADPTKHWKFSINDVAERAYWDDYMAAYEDAVNKCATDYAPWYVVPANKKWYRNLVVARTIADTLEAMNPQYPPAKQGIEHITIPD
jgi:PPK2 family polyphosphate:nucleotide phosphotransferase